MLKTSIRPAAAAAATLSLLALASVAWTVPARAAGSRTIVGQGVYVCQSKPVALAAEDYDVTLRISLNAPASVAPGETISLSGTATLQFPEKAYQQGKSLGETEADGYSDTLSIGATSNGKTTDVPANRWQTAPFPWRDPVVISAPITLHPFTVPADARGSLTITLPRNERRVPNTATKNPATVAFNGVANNKTSLGNVAEKLGCYLKGSSPGVIGAVPVRAAAPAAAAGPSQTSGAPTGTTAAPATSSGSTTAPVGETTPGAAAPLGALPDPAAAGPVESAPGGTASLSATQPSGAVTSGQAGYYAAASPRSGIFVNSSALLLAGGLVCLVALGYAFLTQYRLRNVQRAMDEG